MLFSSSLYLFAVQVLSSEKTIDSLSDNDRSDDEGEIHSSLESFRRFDVTCKGQRLPFT